MNERITIEGMEYGLHEWIRILCVPPAFAEKFSWNKYVYPVWIQTNNMIYSKVTLICLSIYVASWLNYWNY